LKGGLYLKDGGNYRFLIGQSYRAQPNLFLPPGSGAEERLSDVVGRLVLRELVSRPDLPLRLGSPTWQQDPGGWVSAACRISGVGGVLLIAASR
jgi:hypothetical protein